MVSRRQKRLRKNGKSKRGRRVGGAFPFSFPSLFGGDQCQAANDKVTAAKKAYDDAVAAQVIACKKDGQSTPSKESEGLLSGVTNSFSGVAGQIQGALPSGLTGSPPVQPQGQSQTQPPVGGRHRKLSRNKKRSRVGKRR